MHKTSPRVVVVEYDHEWPRRFEDLRAWIWPVVADVADRIEHVGSTSVPGLCAKPVLDILAGHPPDLSPLVYVAPFVAAGYVHRGDRGIPGHQFFRRGQPRAYHIHLVEYQGRLWREYVGFRDLLRRDAVLANQYAELKRTLAARFPRDRESYIAQKSEFVGQLLRLVE